MSKQYGLIIPGQQKKTTAPAATREVSRPSIFDESSESDGDGPPQLKMKNAPMAPGVMERRIARRQQEKALAEDPTVFQYDELYDDMETKREEEKQTKSNEPRKPKYIERLMVCAERRKLENERRVERQVQKEREEEGEEFKDKESFVTTAYRKKLEELRILEEQEKRDDYLEAIGDVTKQGDLDGFYRHLYEQKTGASKEVKKPDGPTTTAGGDDETISYKPIKSLKTQQRAYRKHHSTDEDASESEGDTKKMHLPNNIDADSDFSIDSSSEDESVEDQKESTNKTQPISIHNASDTGNEESKNLTSESVASVAAEKSAHISNDTATSDIDEVLPTPAPKRIKGEIWKKRTVGAVYDDALKRYFERKATRNA